MDTHSFNFAPNSQKWDFLAQNFVFLDENFSDKKMDNFPTD